MQLSYYLLQKRYFDETYPEGLLKAQFPKPLSMYLDQGVAKLMVEHLFFISLETLIIQSYFMMDETKLYICLNGACKHFIDSFPFSQYFVRENTINI